MEEKYIIHNAILLHMALNHEDIRQMVQMRGMGYTQQEIANELGISKKTVQVHLSRLKKQSKETDDLDDLFWTILVGAGALAIFSKLFGKKP